MPHSLRAKIKGLRYKGIITDKDCDRLCKALDNENVLEKIRVEIEETKEKFFCTDGERQGLDVALGIIDKYRNEVGS